MVVMDAGSFMRFFNRTKYLFYAEKNSYWGVSPAAGDLKKKRWQAHSSPLTK